MKYNIEKKIVSISMSLELYKRLEEKRWKRMLNRSDFICKAIENEVNKDESRPIKAL